MRILLIISAFCFIGCRTTSYSVLADHSTQIGQFSDYKIKSIYDYESLNKRLSDSLIHYIKIYDFQDNSYKCEQINISVDTVFFTTNKVQKSVGIEFIKKIEVVEKYYKTKSTKTFGEIILISMGSSLLAIAVTYIYEIINNGSNEMRTLNLNERKQVSAAVGIFAFGYLILNDYYQSEVETVVFPKFIVEFKKSNQF